jgi:hypothetical protein
MKASELVKKLSNKILGKKVNTPAVGGVAIQVAPEKAPAIPFLDRLGVIQLHENWRN